jgi:hypothetical protein
MPLSVAGITLIKTAKAQRSLVPSRHKMNLTTLAGVLNEQTRVYRLMLNGRIRPEMATKMGFMLDKIRSSVEALPPAPQFLPSSGLTVNVISIECGRYITRKAVERLASGESVYDIAPTDLLEPLAIEHHPVAASTPAVISLHPDRAAEQIVPVAVDVVETETSIENLIETYTELSTKVENDVEVETAPAASGFDIEPDPAA